jgi:hypothetical protein
MKIQEHYNRITRENKFLTERVKELEYQDAHYETVRLLAMSVIKKYGEIKEVVIDSTRILKTSL